MTRQHNRSFWSDRFTHRAGPIWHRLGPVFEIADRMTAREALASHNLLADYVTAPTMFRDPATNQLTPDGNKAILRVTNDGHKHMATVHEKFEVVQPSDIADLLDSPFGDGESLTERWPIDTLGTRNNNGSFFLTLHAGGYDVNGDPMQRYFLIKNGNDGGTALSISVIHLRLKCWNTLSAAIRGADVHIRIPHRANAREVLAAYTTAIAKMELAQQTVQTALQKMARTPITDDQARSVIQRTFAIPEAPQSVRLYGRMQEAGIEIDASDAARFESSAATFERKARAAAHKQEVAFERYVAFNDTDGRENDTASTAWSIFQAVTEVLDNMNGHGDTDDARDTAALEALFGKRAMTRDVAFNAAYAYVQVR